MTENIGINKRKRLITVAACLLVQLCVGILYLWSVFNTPVQTYYGLKENAADLVSSFMIFGFVLGNLGGGFLQDKTNPRLTALIGCGLFGAGIFLTSLLTASSIYLIYLTYSSMAGIGCGFAYGSVLSCLQKWFPTRRGFASGLSVAAFGLSTVIFAPAATALIAEYNVKQTFCILGLGFLIIMLPACILISLPKTDGQAQTVVADGLTPKQAMAKLSFWCIFFTSFFINASWNIILPNIKSLGLTRGLTADAVTIAVMITGLANASGRLSMASISDKLKRHYIMIAMAAVTCAAAIAMIWAGSWAYILVVAIAAFGYGGPSATMPPMTVDICGKKYSGTNYGIILLSLGFSSVIFKLISGALKNATGSMTASFIVGAVSAVIAAGLMVLYGILNAPRKKSGEPTLAQENMGEINETV